MIVSRRSLLIGGGAALVACPAIVRFSSLMPVKSFEFFESPSIRWLQWNGENVIVECPNEVWNDWDFGPALVLTATKYG